MPEKTVTLKCSFIKRQGTGRTAKFVVKRHSDMQPVICYGASPAFRKGTPLYITGIPRKESREDIDVTKIVPDGDPKALESFFGSRSFSGITKKMAQNICAALIAAAKEKPENIYSLTDKEILSSLPDKLKENPNAEKALNAVILLRSYTELYEYIKNNGGAFSSAESLFTAYGVHARTMLKNNPYIGISHGLSLAVCDKIYRSLDNSPSIVYCDKRINGILNVTADRIRQTGACCVKVPDVMRYAKEAQRGSVYPILPDSFILCAIAASERFHITEIKDFGPAIYPVSLYYAEREITEELFRLSANTVLNGICHPEETEGLDSGQKEALRMIETSGVRIVTGGPGVGKTTVIDRMIRSYKRMKPKASIKLAAPTGRAAARISETSGGECAATIHKLLGMRPFGEGEEIRPEYNKDNMLPCGLFVIDEASMVDELLLLDLLRAIPTGSTVIFSGDPMQLPSVDSGTALKDLIASGVFPVVRLTTMHRQDESSLIAENYIKISNRCVDLITGDSFKIETDKREKLLERVLNIYENTEDSGSFQILCVTRKGLLGSCNLNNIIAAGRHGEVQTAKYMPGDKVMMTRNNYSSGYWNGDTGIVEEIKPEGAVIRFYDGRKLILREDFADIEYAFACTVHKAQGSEYDRVMVVLDDSYPGMLTNQIILTAVTRAKKSVIILTPAGALETAIKGDAEEFRTTGLTQAVIEKWKHFLDN